MTQRACDTFIKNTFILLFIGFFLVSKVCHAVDDQTLSQKIRNIPLGAKQEEVLNSLGEPQAVVSRYMDTYGRAVEVWKYSSGPTYGNFQQNIFSGSSPELAAQVSVPKDSLATDDAATRAKRELESWDRVQKAGMSNPADALYKPTLRKLPQSTGVNSNYGPPQAYFVTLVNGEVQSVNLSSDIQ